MTYKDEASYDSTPPCNVRESHLLSHVLIDKERRGGSGRECECECECERVRTHEHTFICDMTHSYVTFFLDM